jgi:hypothetical protein
MGSVAEAVAAGICWLARWQTARPDFRVDLGKGVGFYHRDGCRFCAMSPDELLTLSDLSKFSNAQLTSWAKASRKTRAARIYEAQGEPWWEGVAD